MIKAGIVGVSGYSGIELFHILKFHPEVEIVAIATSSHDGERLNSIYPHLFNNTDICKEYSPKELSEICDVLFTAVPHGGMAIKYAESIKNAGKKIIDLSADFRLKNVDIYNKWYNTKHSNTELLNEAVYGLPELHKEEIKKSWLIANPGCYTTAAILSIAPLLNKGLIDETRIIIDSKSGISGAGRKIKDHLHFPEVDEGFCAYSIGNHRHTPEIEQELSLLAKKEIKITFTPHLVPMIRGILSVAYLDLIKELEVKKIIDIFKNFYNIEPFVRIFEDNLPNTKYVAGSNFIDISVQIDMRNNRLIVISAIDNLIKGASGQAVQNMNLLFGLEETTGLKLKPIYP